MKKSILCAFLLLPGICVWAGGGNENANDSNQTGTIVKGELAQYIKRAEAEIAFCEFMIKQIRNTNSGAVFQKKIIKKLNELENEKIELQEDLYSYIHFGIGDVLLFVREFDNDVGLLKRDLLLLEKMQQVEVQIASGN